MGSDLKGIATRTGVLSMGSGSDEWRQEEGCGGRRERKRRRE